MRDIREMQTEEAKQTEESKQIDETTAETTARRRQDRKKRQRNRRLLIAAMTVLVLGATLGLFAQHLFVTSVYDSEGGLQDFADQQFQNMHVLPEAEDRVVTVSYGDTVSFGYRFDPSENEDLAVFRDQRVEELQKAFTEKAAREDAGGSVDEDSIFYRPVHHALLIDSAVYETGNGAMTMAIVSAEYKEKDGEMVRTQSRVNTYLMDPDTLRILNPLQVLTPDYKEKAAVYTAEYLHKAYGDEERQDGGEGYLAESDDNFNEFVFTDKGMTFFFDEGTVLKPSLGSTSVTVPKEYLGAVVRNKILDRYIDPNKPMVALTFDDGPGGEAEAKILKSLQKYGAVATFFYLGNRVDYDQDNVKKAYDLGCEIGNHSWDHSELTSLSAKQVRKQITRTNRILKKVTGVSPTLFRPPYGSYNQEVLDAADMPSILWTVDTLDWSSRNAKKVIKKVKKVKKLDGKIILMHSLYDSTAKATEKLIPWLQKQGYQLVTVTELIKYKSGEAPKAGETYLSGNE